MKQLLLTVYRRMPLSVKRYLGQQSLLKGVRNRLFRHGNVFKKVKVMIDRQLANYHVQFSFYASIKVAAAAKDKGIETTLLRHSIALLKTYKSHRNDAIILDIGANFGYLSLVWAKTISQAGKVLAFEPNRDVYKAFKSSIDDNRLQTIIHLEQLAVGASSQQITLYLNNTTSNVLQGATTSNTYELPMVSVDDYLKAHPLDRCDLIKIDVDGIELDILKGSIETLKRFQPIYIVETNDDRRILDFFIAQDYYVLDMTLKLYHTDDPLPLNIFAIPNVTDAI